MRKQNEEPNFVVTQTLKHLTLTYIGYIITVGLISLSMNTHTLRVNPFLHICITLLLMYTPYLLLASMKKHKISFYDDRLELQDWRGEFLAQIYYKDIKEFELKQQDGMNVAFSHLFLTHFYIFDGDTTICLKTFSLTPKDRNKIQEFIQKEIKKLNI